MPETPTLGIIWKDLRRIQGGYRPFQGRPECASESEVCLKVGRYLGDAAAISSSIKSLNFLPTSTQLKHNIHQTLKHSSIQISLPITPHLNSFTKSIQHNPTTIHQHEELSSHRHCRSCDHCYGKPGFQPQPGGGGRTGPGGTRMQASKLLRLGLATEV